MFDIFSTRFLRYYIFLAPTLCVDAVPGVQMLCAVYGPCARRTDLVSPAHEPVDRIPHLYPTDTGCIQSNVPGTLAPSEPRSSRPGKKFVRAGDGGRVETPGWVQPETSPARTQTGMS